MEIIRVENLTKIFNGQRVVDDLSFKVYEGETFGILGPNGAGKTTTIKMLIGVYRPVSGRIIIKGYDVQREPIEVKRLIGVCPQEFCFDHHLSIEEDLYFYARLYGLPRSEARRRVREVLEWMKLDRHSKKRANQLSGGMQRRLLMARAVITEPPILFLDEPTTGLDPQSRRVLWRYISEMKERGKTIILTTHYLEEAELLCDRVIIIDCGKKIAEGTPEDLKRVLKVTGIVKIRPKSYISPIVIERIKGVEGVENIIWQNDLLKIYLRDECALETIIRLVLKDTGILWIDIEKASLEDVFLYLTGVDVKQ